MSALKHKIRCSLCEDVPVPAVFLLPRYSDPVAWGGMPTYVGVCAQHAEAWWDGDEPPQEATHYALTEVPAASLRPVPSSSVGRMAPRERRED